jgi:glucosamine 6-phosphate synthetase-like amidotransferase/phosphosugar isomerase protein
MLERIEKLQKIANFMPIIVTDIKDKTIRDRMTAFSENRIFFVQRSGYKYDGFTLSALLCVIPLQRLAYDLTLALGYHPDRPRNLAKELTT